MSKTLLAIVFFTPIIIGLVLYLVLLSPVDSTADIQIFSVSQTSSQLQTVDDLFSQNYIRYPWLFRLISPPLVQPGGYYLSKSMNLWQIRNKIGGQPDLIWLTFSPGLRKEQIGQILAKNLNWPDQEIDKWNTVYTTTSPDYLEGVYFPDTYLIPINETGDKVAQRMINQFMQKIEPYFEEFSNQNIKWTTGLKIASLLERESGGADMSLIAGVIWKRLSINMRLEIDATVQYARGQTASGWWTPPTSSDIRSIDSPYNTYKYKGLPPTPICNPSLAAIKAVLYPQETDCLFYLHDSSGQIHCAKDYQQHIENIKEFL